jgi:hypothetical protein
MLEPSIHTDDFYPRLQDAGVITSLEAFAAANRTVAEVEEEAQSWLLRPSWTQLKRLIADWKASGKTTKVVVEGETLPTGVVRLTAPTGLGQNETALWISTPSADGTKRIRWYRNGELKVDLPFNDMSILKSTVGVVAGDIVQICIVAADGTVGWWLRGTVT